MYKILLTAVVVVFSTTLTFAQADSAAVYLKKAQDEKAKGRLMETYKQIDKAYSFNKTDKQVVSMLATTLLELRRYPQAREKFLELEKLGDKSPETYKQLMDLSFNLRQLDDAIKYAQLVKKADPNAKIAFPVGKAYYDQENYGEAIKYLTVATQEDPQNGEAPYLIARAYADMSNYKQAMPFFEKAIALQPNNARLLYETGLMYYAMYDKKNTLKYLQLAAEKGYKKDNEFMENLAIAYLDNNEFDKGMEILMESLKRRPSDTNLLNMIAEAAYDAKKFDLAIDYWDRILAMDKENASALYMIGMSYQKKGDKAKGQALCDKAIEMDPSLAKNKKEQKMGGF
jgi:tetratricopeptide (TPR) repeat protein